MGKATDEHIKKLTDLTAQCAVHVALIFDQTTVINAQLAELEKLSGIMDARTDHFLKGKKRTPEAEQAVLVDPEFAKAAALTDSIAAKNQAIVGKRVTARADLKKALLALKTQADLFKAFIAAKEQKWLGNKKSVPTAKAAVESAYAYIKSCTPLTTG